MKKKEDNDFHQLLVKAERFCAYQERSSFEVRKKMKEFDADEKTIELILTSLLEDDFQNDERFAMLFASGKFRIKRWGKNKIRSELRMKHIPDALIKKGLDAINREDYLKTLKELAKKKEKEVRGEKSEVRSQKIGRFLLSKGYESELIWKALKPMQD
jgi:regulatory protein